MTISTNELVQELVSQQRYAVLPYCIDMASPERENYRESDLREAYATDPLLSAAVFKAAGKPDNPLTTLEPAQALLGINAFTALSANTESVTQSLSGEQLSAYLRTVQRAYHTACLARELATQQGYKKPQELFYAGLLAYVGELAIRQRRPELGLKIDLLTDKPAVWSGQEKKTLGTSIDSLTLTLAEHWNLPLLLRDAISSSKNINPKANLVRVARETLQLCAINPLSGKLDQVLKPLAAGRDNIGKKLRRHVFMASVTAAQSLADKIPELNSNRSILFYPTPFAWPEERKKVLQNQIKNTPKKTDIAEKPPLSKHATSANKPTPNQIIKLTLDDFYSRSGIERIMFALINQKSEQIEGRYFLGISEGDELRKLQVSSKQKNLFTQLLRKPQHIRVNQENMKKIEPLMSEELKQYLTNNRYYLSSVFINNKPVGLLYADGNLRTGSYDAFKQTVTNLSLKLGKLSAGGTNKPPPLKQAS